MKVSYKTFNLPFKHPFTISKGTKTHQPTFVVELDHFGLKDILDLPGIDDLKNSGLLEKDNVIFNDDNAK